MYKVMTLAGGICEPLLTCSSLLAFFNLLTTINSFNDIISLFSIYILNASIKHNTPHQVHAFQEDSSLNTENRKEALIGNQIFIKYAQ